MEFIYRLENVQVMFYNQTIMLNDLMVVDERFYGTFSRLVLNTFTVLYSDGSQVSIDQIFELFPGLEFYAL